MRRLRPEPARPYLNLIRSSQLSRLLRQLPKCPAKPQRKNVKTNFTLVRTSWDRPAPNSGHRRTEGRRAERNYSSRTGPQVHDTTGTIGEAVQCICNMVPPLLTKAVAESIYEWVLKPLKQQDIV
jgi:hypothetical protein